MTTPKPSRVSGHPREGGAGGATWWPGPGARVEAATSEDGGRWLGRCLRWGRWHLRDLMISQVLEKDESKEDPRFST